MPGISKRAFNKAIGASRQTLTLVAAILVAACAAPVTNAPSTASPAPTLVPQEEVVETLNGWIARWNPQMSGSSEGPIFFGTLLDEFDAVNRLTIRSTKPLAASLLAALADLKSVSTSVTQLLRSDAKYPNAVREQRTKANLVTRELVNLKRDYPQIMLAVETAVPLPRVVQKPDQLIMPLSEFPLTGFKIGIDKVIDPDGWQRQFVPTSFSFGNSYYFVDVRLFVYPQSVDSNMAYLFTTCEAGSKTPPISSEEISAASSGDHAKACRQKYSDSTRFDYKVFYRNVAVEIYLNAAATTSDGVAIDQAIALARQQLAIVDRVSPPGK